MGQEPLLHLQMLCSEGKGAAGEQSWVIPLCWDRKVPGSVLKKGEGGLVLEWEERMK